MLKNDIVQIRVNPSEKLAWEAAARARDMPLSRWLRSAAATFLVCGKATVLVPAGYEEPPYLDTLRREAADDEAKTKGEKLAARRRGDAE